MSKHDRKLLQLVAILHGESWREDQHTLEILLFYVHKNLGVGWQTAIFSARSSQLGLSVFEQPVQLYFEDSRLMSINIGSGRNSESVDGDAIAFAELVSLLMLASEIQVLNVGSSHLQKVRDDYVRKMQGKKLHRQLMKEYYRKVGRKRQYPRFIRLLIKFYKKPKLFFQDSKQPLGRLVYSMIHMMDKGHT